MTAVCLGDLAERVRERVPAGSRAGRFVGLEHLVPGQLRIAGWSPARDQRSDGVAFRRGDVLFGALRPGFRKVAIAPFDGVGSSELWVLRPKGDERPGFVLAWLAHPRRIAEYAAMATGTRMPRVRWADVAAERGWVPDRPTRNEIADLAALFDARLALLHQRDATAAALIRRRVASIQPDDGPTVADVAQVRAPAVPSGASGPVLSVADLPSDGLTVHTWGRDPGRSAKRAIGRGDVLVSRLRPALRKSGLAPFDGMASPEVVAWIVEPVWHGVVAGVVTRRAVQAHWTARATGTRMPRVSVTDLGAIRTGLDEVTARRLAPALAPLVEHLVDSPGRAQALRQVRDRVLADLIDAAMDPAAARAETG